MMQQKAFGSLTGSLLARKGGARPAMRPQAYRFDEGDVSAEDDDCGWNDMGADMLTPEQRDSLLPAGNVTSIVTAPVRRADEHGQPAAASPARTQQRALAAEMDDERTGPDGTCGEQDAEGREARIAAEAEVEAPGAEAARLEDDDRDEQHAFLARLQAESSETGPLEEEASAPAVSADRAAPVSPPKMRAAPGGKARAAFTLRLDKARHLKLRLACAFSHSSAQRLMTDALDEYLERHHPDLPA